jgi:hypothetical protein
MIHDAKPRDEGLRRHGIQDACNPASRTYRAHGTMMSAGSSATYSDQPRDEECLDSVGTAISRLEALKAAPVFLHVAGASDLDIGLLCEEASQILDALERQCCDQARGSSADAPGDLETALQYAGYVVDEVRRSLYDGDTTVAAAQLADAVPSLRNVWIMLTQS